MAKSDKDDWDKVEIGHDLLNKQTESVVVIRNRRTDLPGYVTGIQSYGNDRVIEESNAHMPRAGRDLFFDDVRQARHFLDTYDENWNNTKETRKYDFVDFKVTSTQKIMETKEKYYGDN